MDWKLALILTLLLLLVIFTAQNYEVVEIQFLFFSFRTSRAIIIFCSVLIGIAIGWITTYMKMR